MNTNFSIALLAAVFGAIINLLGGWGIYSAIGAFVVTFILSLALNYAIDWWKS